MDTLTEYKLVDDAAYPIGPPIGYTKETDTIVIPPSRIRGRIHTIHTPSNEWGTPVNSPQTSGRFKATISEYGRLRIDNSGCDEFWLEIDMPEIMQVIQEHMYHPDGTIAQESGAEFKEKQVTQ